MRAVATTAATAAVVAAVAASSVRLRAAGSAVSGTQSVGLHAGQGRVAAAHIVGCFVDRLADQVCCTSVARCPEPHEGMGGGRGGKAASSCARNLFLRQTCQTGREGEMQSAEGSGRCNRTIGSHFEYVSAP